MQISPGKVITFVLVTILGGLVQVWILWLILVIGLKKSVGVADLLGDGGLFFFSTSITVSSFLLLSDKHALKFGSLDLNITLLLAGVTGFCAVVIYTSVMSANFGAAQPFKDSLLPEIACAVAASVYAFYTAVRTGQLRRRP